MDEIISLEKRRIEAMINQDAKALDEILADDLSYTHSSGRMETKTEFIANATSGVTRYRALSQEDVKVRTFGDTAIITGHGIVHVESSRGENKFPISFIDIVPNLFYPISHYITVLLMLIQRDHHVDVVDLIVSIRQHLYSIDPDIF